MAKGKNSAALFEVINSGKRTGAGLLRTPKWWFKGRPVGASDAAPTSVSKTPEVIEDQGDEAPQVEAASTISLRTSRANLRVDRMRNEVTMRMRLGTIVVVSFAILVAMGLAYVVGRHVAGGPESANASDASTEQIRQQAPTPNTLDVPRRNSANGSQNRAGATPTTAKHTETARGRSAVPAGDSGNAFNAQPKVELTGPRTMGLNYILVASFAPEKIKLAQQTCDALAAVGVPCSIEKVPEKLFYNPNGNWVAVITRQGFEGKSKPDCQACIQKINEVGLKNPKLNFQPNVFKWM